MSGMFASGQFAWGKFAWASSRGQVRVGPASRHELEVKDSSASDRHRRLLQCTLILRNLLKEIIKNVDTVVELF